MKVKFQAKNLNFATQFTGPMTLQIEHSSGLVRSATASDCTPPSFSMRCEG